MIKKFVLRDSDVRERAMMAVLDAPISDPPYEVVIREHKSDRSLEQNARLWAMHQAASVQLGEDVTVLHAYMCQRFLGGGMYKIRNETVLIANTTTHFYDADTGEFRKLTIKEMGAFMQQVEDMYRSLDVDVGRIYGEEAPF